MWFSSPKFPQSRIQTNCRLFRFQISSVIWTESIWCFLRVKTPFSNFSSVVWTAPMKYYVSNTFEYFSWKCHVKWRWYVSKAKIGHICSRTCTVCIIDFVFPSPPTLKRKARVFKFLRFEERFRQAPFPWRISVDGGLKFMEQNELAAVMLSILSLTITYEPNTAHWKWKAILFNVWHCANNIVYAKFQEIKSFCTILWV